MPFSYLALQKYLLNWRKDSIRGNIMRSHAKRLACNSTHGSMRSTLKMDSLLTDLTGFDIILIHRCGWQLPKAKAWKSQERFLVAKDRSTWTCNFPTEPCRPWEISQFNLTKTVLALLQPHRWTFQLLYSPTVQLKLRFLSTQRELFREWTH